MKYLKDNWPPLVIIFGSLLGLAGITIYQNMSHIGPIHRACKCASACPCESRFMDKGPNLCECWQGYQCCVACGCKAPEIPKPCCPPAKPKGKVGDKEL